MHLVTVFLTVAFAAGAWSEKAADDEEFNVDLFDMFKRQYDKTYTNEIEEDRRQQIFADNLLYIQQHNRKYELGQSSFYLGVNEYTDLDLHEFLGPISTESKTETSLQQRVFKPAHYDVQDYPNSIDWRKNGSVTAVRNQGNCYSGWAFSAVGALEGQWYLGRRPLTQFSEQQLIDCPNSQPNFTTHGCAGGIPTNAYLSISESGGIELESDYPYEGKDNVCRFNSSLVKTSIGGWVSMGDNPSEETLQHMAVLYGPLSVRIDGNHASFQHYKGGIYDEPSCSNTTLNHAALLVGYNTGPDYWIVKNSLGVSWGEKGYIRMIRNKFNQCGIANNASVPF